MKKLCLFVTIAALAACSGDVTAPSGVTQFTGKPALVIDSGNNQTAAVATRLSQPIVSLVLSSGGSVRVADSRFASVMDGTPVVGMQLCYNVTTVGGGTPFLACNITDSTGRARNFWDLGTVAGTHCMETRAIQNGQPVALDTACATATAGATDTVRMSRRDTAIFTGGRFRFSIMVAHSSDAYGNSTSPSSFSLSLPSGWTSSGDTIIAPSTFSTGAVVVTAPHSRDSTLVEAYFDRRLKTWAGNYTCGRGLNSAGTAFVDDSATITLRGDSVRYLSTPDAPTYYLRSIAVAFNAGASYRTDTIRFSTIVNLRLARVDSSAFSALNLCGQGHAGLQRSTKAGVRDTVVLAGS